MSSSKVARIAIVVLGLLGTIGGQSNAVSPPGPRFSEMTQEDVTRLQRQREVVAAAVKQYRLGRLSGSKADLPVLQGLIDRQAFRKSQTYELQCPGVAFGDVLSSELPLRWVMVTDEYGTDPTLRFKETTIQINALTMISKRVERNEKVDVSYLLRMTREQLEKTAKTAR